MDEVHVKKVLKDAWRTLGCELADGREAPIRGAGVEDAKRVFQVLCDTPWTPAREIGQGLGLDRDRMILAYKCMQRAEGLVNHFRKTVHSDYFNVVRHYFNNRFYTLVFFVGTACPSRCLFCPNVTLHSDGHRTITSYGEGMQALEEPTIDKMFGELERLKIDGTELLVKISGGLEPMTDVKTLRHIAQRSRDLAVPVKLFTNGILLNTDERRRAALLTGDIRISLSTADAGQYEEINFGKRQPRSRLRLDHLKENLRNLVRMRDLKGESTKIGFNSIIMPSNQDQVIPLMHMARDLGVDYIDFKPDYFGAVGREDQKRIMDTVARATELGRRAEWKGLYVHFAGAMQRDHLFWRSWQGVCDAVKQVDYKMFITPFGHLSPIHYGAFPHNQSAPHKELELWSVGRLGETRPFLDVLANPDPIPEVGWSQLNPFELMLSLEIEREARDSEWGIPISCSPYHTSRRHELPHELKDAWKRGRMHAV